MKNYSIVCRFINVQGVSRGKENISRSDSRAKTKKIMLYKHGSINALFSSFGHVKIKSIFLYQKNNNAK